MFWVPVKGLVSTFVLSYDGCLKRRHTHVPSQPAKFAFTGNSLCLYHLTPPNSSKNSGPTPPTPQKTKKKKRAPGADASAAAVGRQRADCAAPGLVASHLRVGPGPIPVHPERRALEPSQTRGTARWQEGKRGFLMKSLKTYGGAL